MTGNITSDQPLRMVELFAGIGAQAQALENLGIPYTSTVCEIDKRAYESYCAIHGDAPNLGDITEVQHLPECDLLTYSFPCQDLSVAGNQTGMQEGSGTRSSLLWEVGRLLEDAEKKGTLPKYLLMENVDAILNKKNIGEFNRWIDKLRQMGYTSSYQVLNAKDFGVPQNRRRCFMVSSLNGMKYQFPEGFQTDTRLRDILEDEVDESYFLSDEKIEKYQAHKQRHQDAGDGFGWHPTHGNDVGSSVTTKPERPASNFIIEEGEIPDQSLKYPAGTKQGYMDAYFGDGLVMNRLQTARGTVQVQTAPTLTTGKGCDTGTVGKWAGKLRVRYLTPLECWRLMGFPDSSYQKAVDVGMPKTHLYKQAGNSIVVDVLMAIFKGMFIDNTWEIARSLEAWL